VKQNPLVAELFMASQMNGATPAEPVNFNTTESLQRSAARVRRPPREALNMLREMGEHRSFWFALRKHGNDQQAMRWLSIFHANSNWAENKKSDSERLRKEYFRLLDGIRVFDPAFRDLFEHKIHAEGTSNIAWGRKATNKMGTLTFERHIAAL
jgi:hypothetical protein